MGDGRNQQLTRVLGVLRDLDRLGGLDLYELAERHGVDTRTIRRDLAALEEAGLPLLKERRGRRMTWRIGWRDPLRKVGRLLDTSHYLALRVAMSQGPSVGAGSALYAALEDLCDKVEGVLGQAGRARLEALEACFHPYGKHAWRDAPPESLWALIDAIPARRVCRVTYRAPSADPADKTYEVLPLRVYAHDGAVRAWCLHLGREQVISLNLHRLRRVDVLDRTAEPPADFDPVALERSAFAVTSSGPLVTYRMRFDPEVAAFIEEREWHPTQELVSLAGGGVELSFTCAETWEVAAWVASWGRLVEVLQPGALRSSLLALGDWYRATYGRLSAPK